MTTAIEVGRSLASRGLPSCMADDAIEDGIYRDDTSERSGTRERGVAEVRGEGITFQRCGGGVRVIRRGQDHY